jgi:hypothetical protein
MIDPSRRAWNYRRVLKSRSYTRFGIGLFWNLRAAARTRSMQPFESFVYSSEHNWRAICAHDLPPRCRIAA